MKPLLFSLTLLVSVSCSGLGKKLLQEPKVRIDRVNVESVDAKGATVVFDLDVENPNPFALKVDALKYDVEIGGKKLTVGELKSPANVGAKTTSKVSLPIPVKFNDLFSSVLVLAQKGKSPYVIKGEATFGLLSVPFENRGEIDLFK
jgi:LEA14-like dessication related protein